MVFRAFPHRPTPAEMLGGGPEVGLLPQNYFSVSAQIITARLMRQLLLR